MKKILSTLFSVFFLVAAAVAEPVDAQVKGRVCDSITRQPLPMAFVMIEGQETGITVSTSGEFVLPLPPSANPAFLLVFCEGYEDGRIPIPASLKLEIRLDKQVNIHETVTVTAQSGVSEQPRQAATLKKMDVYSIPGTAADPLLTATVLPGVNATPDSSDLIIRGGAPGEVAYYFDGMEIPHPFLSNSAQASYFSIFDNQFIKSFNVTNSGFDPKFGNALSGIVDLQPQEEAASPSGGIGISIMGGQGMCILPLGSRAGLLASAKFDFNDLLARINGHHSSLYSNGNTMGSLYWKNGGYSRLKLTWLFDAYGLGDGPAFDLHSTSQLLGLTYSTVIGGRIFARLMAAAGYYKNDMIFAAGRFSRSYRDFTPQLRFDAIASSTRHEINFGLDMLHREENLALPVDPVDSGASGTRFGLYCGDKIRLGGSFAIHPTLRLNLLRCNGRFIAAVDPALSMAWSISSGHTLRATAGLYHQYADGFSYALQPDILPKQALHLALTYDYIREALQMRFSVFDKEYRNLLLNEGSLTNNGSGFARGVEFYLKNDGRHLNVMLIYNLLLSERREGEILKMTHSAYEIPHALTAVLSWKSGKTQIGLRASYASGMPYTPLEASRFEPDLNVFLAEYGEPNSLRLPYFSRIDLNFNQRLTVRGRMVVLFLGIVNLLDRNNIQFSQFNPENGRLEFIRSLFQRSFFIGMYYPL